MRSTLWIGRVRSDVVPDLLSEAFSKFGKVRKVETGFGGFAFVEFEDEGDSDRACEGMHKASIQGIGEIRVNKSTFRGYQDACAKRSQYWRARGHKEGNTSWSHVVDEEKRARGRQSPSGRRKRDSMSQSHSKSGSRPRRSRTWSRPSRSASRSSKGSRRRRRSPSNRSRSPVLRFARSCSPCEGPKRTASEELTPGTHLAQKAHAEEAEAEEPGTLAPEVQSKASSSAGPPLKVKKEVHNEGREEQRDERQLAAASALKGDKVRFHINSSRPAQGMAPASELGLPPPEEGEEAAQLSCADRAAMVCFFDGANACDLLLEGASVLRLPDFYIPYMLNGFPHGFQGLSQEDGMKLLDVMSGIARGDSEGDETQAGGEERAAEVRQTVLIDSRGRRIMRKCLLINGQEVCSEEQTI